MTQVYVPVTAVYPSSTPPVQADAPLVSADATAVYPMASYPPPAEPAPAYPLEDYSGQSFPAPAPQVWEGQAAADKAIRGASAGLIIGIVAGAFLLLAVLGGAGFYMWQKKAAATVPSAAATQSQPDAATEQSVAVTDTAAKPDAGTPVMAQPPEASPAAAPPTTSTFSPTPGPPRESPSSKPADLRPAPVEPAYAEPSRHSAPAPIERMAVAPTMPDFTQPSPNARSGMLHYSGAPVPRGGAVVFSKLPAGMLRFTFDHDAWQPLISHQPDGTQTLTLRSLKQGEQTECDVRWEFRE